MFLIDLTFTAPIDTIDKYVAAHRQYLSNYYGQGLLFLGGRKVPRTGGVIISRQKTLAEVHDLFSADPLILANVASYVVIEFDPVMFSNDLEEIILN